MSIVNVFVGACGDVGSLRFRHSSFWLTWLPDLSLYWLWLCDIVGMLLSRYEDWCTGLQIGGSLGRI